MKSITPALTLKTEWLNACRELASLKADLYSGARKILTARRVEFTSLDDSLQLIDAGYTKSKQTMLTRHYLHNESRDVALQLWNKRRGQVKYGSVGFTCYAHFIKGGDIDAKRSKRASVFGPCIQSVNITWVNKTTYTIDVFYRTTEFFKKFPADLCFLRDVLIKPFDFTGMKLGRFNCHFANITMHPMYAVTIFPHLDPIEFMEEFRNVDKHFFQWVIKWSARYLCPEHSRGIQKFSQALRVQADVMRRLRPIAPTMKYLRKHHPGFRNDYEDEDDDV